MKMFLIIIMIIITTIIIIVMNLLPSYKEDKTKRITRYNRIYTFIYGATTFASYSGKHHWRTNRISTNSPSRTPNYGKDPQFIKARGQPEPKKFHPQSILIIIIIIQSIQPKASIRSIWGEMYENIPQDGELPVLPEIGTNFIILNGTFCILLHI